MRFTVGTHNTFRGVARFLPIASIILRQEMYFYRSRARMSRQQPNYDHYIPMSGLKYSAGSNPISWDKRVWRFLGGDFRQATFKFMYLVGPYRWVTYVILEHIATGQKVIVVNCHFPNPGRRPWRKWLAARWAENKRVLDQLIVDIGVAHPGMPIIVGGDMNRRTWIQVPGLTTPKPYGPIDQFLHSAGVRMINIVRRRKNGSDHYAYVAMCDINGG